MEECELCGTEGSRVQVNHKQYGRIMVCRNCWSDIYEKGQKISEGTGSSSTETSLGCSACSY